MLGEELRRRKPVKRPHREIVGAVVVDSELV
jgi:sensor histidine kinase regulating citrate/malate metabolism